MSLTASEFLQTCLAVPTLLLLLIPTGYAVAYITDIAAFRVQSATEQLLWSVSLSLPTGLVLANIPARYLSRFGTLSSFSAC